MAQGKAERRGLGRGLSALMADVDTAPREQPAAPRKAEQVIDIARIAPNPDQPRRTFTEDALEELAASIREKGIIQPLILRVNPRDPDQIFAVLSIAWEGAEDPEDPSGTLRVTLSGDGEIAVDAEYLDLRLEDVTRPYLAPSGKAPEHE